MPTTKARMFQIVAATITAAVIAGCGSSEPSNEEIARGMMRSFVRKTGVNPALEQLRAKARKIGNGRWAVTMEAIGGRLNATAVMDKNGDIHYYTD